MAELLAALSSSLAVMAILMVMARILDGLKAKMAGIWYSAQHCHCHWIFIATWLGHDCWLYISLSVCLYRFRFFVFLSDLMWRRVHGPVSSEGSKGSF